MVGSARLACRVIVCGTLTLAGCGGDDSSSGPPANSGGQAGAGGTGATGGEGGQAGTGGGETGGDAGQGGLGGSQGPSLDEACQHSCDKTVEAGCSAGPTAANCWAGCMSTFSPYPGCEAQAVDFLECAATTGTVTCDSNGVPVSSGCQAENIAVSQCSVCVVVPEDGPCKACGKQQCCAEARAVLGEPTTGAYVGCMQGCADQTCRDGCNSTYPNAASAALAAAQCLQNKCKADCS